jgi:energy-coupling factor transport system permease protein
VTVCSLYHPGDTFLYHLNPVTKLVFLLCCLLLTFLLPGNQPPWFLFAFFLILAGLNRLLSPVVKILLRVVTPLALFLFVVHGLFSPEGHTQIAAIGPFSLKREGMTFALLMTGRILSALSASLLFVFSTSPAILMSALAQKGCPGSLTYIVGSALQIIPQMRAKTASIMAAQQAHGLETTGSLFVRIRALLPMLVPLVLSSLVDVEERAIALEARAFRKRCRKTSLTVEADPVTERVLRWVAFVVTVAVLVVECCR